MYRLNQIPKSAQWSVCHDDALVDKRSLDLIIVMLMFLFTFDLCRNKDSSVCTTTPGPPKTIGLLRSLVEHTSLSH